MKGGRPSVTAQRVAIRRAVHQLVDRPIVFVDRLASDILGHEVATALRADPAAFEGGALDRALRAFIVVRSRLAEDLLADSVKRGVRQYVLLGAGLETFAYRNPHPGLRVFEVDHPATQAWKRGRLAEAHIDIPASVAFVPCRFEQDAIVDALRAAGLDDRRPTFFAWLGVTPYVEKSVTLETIRAVAPLAAGGGGIVFDYSGEPDSLGPYHRAAFDALAARVAAVGEPFVGFFEPSLLAALVSAAGFSEVRDYTPDELSAHYLADRTDGLSLRRVGHIMFARR